MAHRGLMVRDARLCRAPHHEGPRPRPNESGSRPHPKERALARVSKDEATKLENALALERQRDRGLRFLLDLPQVRRALKTLGVDLVDILGARRPRGEPPIVGG